MIISFALLWINDRRCQGGIFRRTRAINSLFSVSFYSNSLSQEIFFGASPCSRYQLRIAWNINSPRASTKRGAFIYLRNTAKADCYARLIFGPARLRSAPRILLGVQARLEGRANGFHKTLGNVTSALEIHRSVGMTALYEIPVNRGNIDWNWSDR